VTVGVALLAGLGVWLALPLLLSEPAGWLRVALTILAVGSSVLADPRPRIVVEDGTLRAGWRRIPLADVRRVTRDRRAHRLEADVAEPPCVHWRVGTVLARDGVLLEAWTPEGLPYEVWIASDDPDRLAAVLTHAAGEAPQQGRVGASAGYRGPRGAIWWLALPLLGLGLVVTWVATGIGTSGRLLASGVLAALVVIPASRPIEVSERRVRSGAVDVPTDRIVAARLAGRGELLPHWQQLPRRNRALSAWGPSHLVVLVTSPPGERAEDRLAATHLVALPRAVDLHALLPSQVVGRRLPPV
jgi:hypothetical protein